MRGERLSDATSEDSMCSTAKMKRGVKFAKEVQCVEQPVTRTLERKPLDTDKQPSEGHDEAVCPPPHPHTMPCTLSRYRPKKLWKNLLLPVDMHSLRSAEGEVRSEDCDTDGVLVARDQGPDHHPVSDFQSLPLVRVRKATAARFNELVSGEFMGKVLMYFAQPVGYGTTSIDACGSNASIVSGKQDGQNESTGLKGR